MEKLVFTEHRLWARVICASGLALPAAGLYWASCIIWRGFLKCRVEKEKEQEWSLVPYRTGVSHSPPWLRLWLSICLAQEVCDSEVIACEHQLQWEGKESGGWWEEGAISWYCECETYEQWEYQYHTQSLQWIWCELEVLSAKNVCRGEAVFDEVALRF